MPTITNWYEEVLKRLGNIETLIPTAGGGGGSGGDVISTAVASENISEGDPLYILGSGQVAIANLNSLAEATVRGIALNTVTAGSSVSYQTEGEVCLAVFAFTVGVDIYLGAGGTLTSTPPVTGFLTKIGFSKTATDLELEIEAPVIL